MEFAPNSKHKLPEVNSWMEEHTEDIDLSNNTDVTDWTVNKNGNYHIPGVDSSDLYKLMLYLFSKSLKCVSTFKA
jgi:hypothetical protein